MVYPLVPAEFEFVRVATPLVRSQQRGFLAEAVHHSIDVIRSSDFDVIINNSLSALPYVFMQNCTMMTILHTPPTLADVTAVLTHADWVPSPKHRWVTVSDSNADAWRPLLPDVQTVHNGIRVRDWIGPESAVPGRAVWAARITPEKGLHLAIDAALLAGMEIEFAGPIAHSDYFADEIEPRLGDRVRYRGHLAHEELRRLIGSGSVFIASPLWAEPFGLSVVESFAAGTPVAAFASGAMPELIDDTNGALAFDSSAASLARAVTLAATRNRDATRRSALRFDFERMIDDYETVLESLVAATRPVELAT
jgi:glycosyltransferase involved in cell wall biosynthesis